MDKCGGILQRLLHLRQTGTTTVRHLTHACQRVTSGAKPLLKANFLDDSQRRSLGWLLGPPPEPGSPEHKLKTNNILKCVLVAQIIFGFYLGVFRVSLHNEAGEFQPRLGYVNLTKEEAKKAQEELDRRVEEELLKAKQAKLLESLKLPVPLPPKPFEK